MEFLLMFDTNVVQFVNGFVHRWWALDRIFIFFGNNSLVKGSIVLAVFYFIWFGSKEAANSIEVTEKRLTLLYTLFVCVPAVLVARLMAWCLPFRIRPIHDSVLQLSKPFAFEPDTLIDWSSFPSDHAVLFFTLATGIFLAHRSAGLLLYVHAIVIVALPRLYLGVHYPSDLLAGAVIGCGIGYSAKSPLMRSLVTRQAWRLKEISPGLFYGGLFYLAMSTAEGYEQLRTAAIGAWQVLKHLLDLF